MGTKNNQKIADLFLQYSGQEYHQIEKLIKKPFNRIKYDCDILHDTILKVYDIIIRKGFRFIDNKISLSGESFLNYVFQAYSTNNLMKKTNVDKNLNREVSIDLLAESEELINVEQKYNLVTDDEDELDLKIGIMIAEDYYIDEIYQWVDSNFSPIQSGFFKFYYKNKITYKAISEFTRYSESFIFLKVKEVKVAVKKQFVNVKFPNRNLTKVVTNVKKEKVKEINKPKIK